MADDDNGSMSALPATTFNPSGCTRLTDWGVIRAAGADARSFLHGQLTQDMLHFAPGQARLAGYCSAKGRLLASFVVWSRGPEDLLLACSADLLAPTLKRLSMFVLRAKCRLSDASAEVPLFGLVGDLTADNLPVWGHRATPDADLVRLPDAAGRVRHLHAGADVPVLPALALDDWRWLEVQSGVPRIVAATVEQFVPQMVNLEIVGGVNFQKGCYPGQEVVARSQYRGTLKRRAHLFDSDVPARAGQELFASADPGQPAGMVAGAAPRPGGGYSLLAETKLAALADHLHLDSADGPLLRSTTLPYTFPVEA
jgi:folate-binding protein YgfZ